MFPISGFHFYKNYIIYGSVVRGDAFYSFHDRTGLTDVQAKGKFILEHQREMQFLLKQREINERGNTKISL